GSAKQKAVLDEGGAARSSLAGYFGNGEADHAANARLLAACQKHTRPVKPVDIGLIGKDHLEAIFLAAGVAPKSFNYFRKLDVHKVCPMSPRLLSATRRTPPRGESFPGSIGRSPLAIRFAALGARPRASAVCWPR